MTTDVRHNASTDAGGRPKARTISVIEVVFTRGDGRDDLDPVREVKAYFDLDGNKLAEHDPCAKVVAP